MIKYVYIVFDPISEEIISAHSSEEGAIKKCLENDLKDNRTELKGLSKLYPHEYYELKLED
jgi:hypothetical protein